MHAAGAGPQIEAAHAAAAANAENAAAARAAAAEAEAVAAKARGDADAELQRMRAAHKEAARDAAAAACAAAAEAESSARTAAMEAEAYLAKVREDADTELRRTRAAHNETLLRLTTEFEARIRALQVNGSLCTGSVQDQGPTAPPLTIPTACLTTNPALLHTTKSADGLV
jgi:hypothetical protein